MADIWISSDWHLGHSKILTFRDEDGNLIRPGFSNVDEMNECIVETHNQYVKPGDKYYNLGDVFMGEPGEFEKLFSRMNGRKRLIVGNHDDIRYLSRGFFSKVYMWRILDQFGLMLTHVPVHPSNVKVHLAGKSGEDYVEGVTGKVARQMLNVHGHIHQNDSPEGPYRNVCVEKTMYRPINVEELRIW